VKLAGCGDRVSARNWGQCEIYKSPIDGSTLLIEIVSQRFRSNYSCDHQNNYERPDESFRQFQSNSNCFFGRFSSAFSKFYSNNIYSYSRLAVHNTGANEIRNPNQKQLNSDVLDPSITFRYKK